MKVKSGNFYTKVIISKCSDNNFKEIKDLLKLEGITNVIHETSD